MKCSLSPNSALKRHNVNNNNVVGIRISRQWLARNLLVTIDHKLSYLLHLEWIRISMIYSQFLTQSTWISLPPFIPVVKNQQKIPQNDFESYRKKENILLPFCNDRKIFYNKYLFVFSARFKSATDISHNNFFSYTALHHCFM